MLHAIKRLALGIILIATASAILLVTDLGRRRPSTSPVLRVAILQHASAVKERLRADSPLNRFEDVRRADQFDLSAAEILRRPYV
jgi:hypothetical protein